MSNGVVIHVAERDEVAAFWAAAGPLIYASILIGLLTAVCAWALWALEDFKHDR